MLLRVLLVALGGGIGSALRYLAGLALAAPAGPGFPLPTFAVNVAGSFALGLLMAAWPDPSLPRLALTTGVLGGFTTYSAFNEETLELARHGHALPALGYVAATVAGCLVAGAVGAWLGVAARPD